MQACPATKHLVRVPVNRSKRGITLALGLLGCLTLVVATRCVAAPAGQPLRVLTSINPLTLIINEAFGDLVISAPLLPPHASPHFYTLKPSDIQNLAATDLFVWVGPGLERFLPRVLSKSSPVAMVELMSQLRRKHPELLLTISGEALPDDQVRPAPSSESGLGHPPEVAGNRQVEFSTRNLDAHLWMSRQLAMEIAAEVAAELEPLLPAHRESIRQRLQHFRTQLASLDAHVELPGVTLVSYHNAFNYLARELDLHIGDVIISQADLTPGARHFAHLAERFEEQPHCLIIEPQFRDSRLITTLGRLAGAVVELDPMGANAPSYSALYQSWGMELLRCGG